MNSRLGLTHPARSKTTVVGIGLTAIAVSGLSPTNNGGTASGSSGGTGADGNLKPGVMKSRTIDLSSHLSPAVSPSSSSSLTISTHRSLSPQLKRSTDGGGGSGGRENLTRQRSWQSGVSGIMNESSLASRGGEGAWGVTAAREARGAESSAGSSGRGGRSGSAGTNRGRDSRGSDSGGGGIGSLPPLSLTSREVERERDRRYERDRDRGGTGSDKLSPREGVGSSGGGDGGGGGDRRGDRDGHCDDEERKSPKTSTGTRGENAGPSSLFSSSNGSPRSSRRLWSAHRSISSSTGIHTVDGGTPSRGWNQRRERGGGGSGDGGDDDDQCVDQQHRFPSPRGCVPRDAGKDGDGGLGAGQREGGNGADDQGRPLSRSAVGEDMGSCGNVSRGKRDESGSPSRSRSDGTGATRQVSFFFLKAVSIAMSHFAVLSVGSRVSKLAYSFGSRAVIGISRGHRLYERLYCSSAALEHLTLPL